MQHRGPADLAESGTCEETGSVPRIRCRPRDGPFAGAKSHRPVQGTDGSVHATVATLSGCAQSGTTKPRDLALLKQHLRTRVSSPSGRSPGPPISRPNTLLLPGHSGDHDRLEPRRTMDGLHPTCHAAPREVERHRSESARRKARPGTGCKKGQGKMRPIFPSEISI